jgi:hypothetical protein
LLASETVLGSNLRKQKTPVRTPCNEQAVAPDLNFGGIDRGGRRKQRYLNLKSAKIFHTHGRKTRVLQSGTGGTTHNAVSERLVRVDDAYAAPQTPPRAQRYKHSAALGENSLVGNILWELRAGDSLLNSVPRQAQQILAVRFREGRHPRFSRGPAASEAFGVA